MTFQQKLALAFSMMIIPLFLIGAQSLWSLRQETSALKALEASLERRTIFADLENTLYGQIRQVWSYLTGWDKEAKQEFIKLNGIIVEKMAKWKRTVVDPEEARLTHELEGLHLQIKEVANKVFALHDRGKRGEAFRVAQEELKKGILPKLNQTVKEIYRISRVLGFQKAFKEVNSIEHFTSRVLLTLVIGSILLGILFAVLISRSLARPIEELKKAMDVVGEGHLDHKIEAKSNDEVGELARSFATMTEKLREAQARLIQSEKLASIGQMSAAVAHGLRNPLSSIRAAAQLSLHRLPPEAPIREQLQAVIAEVDRLERRIHHLLDFTKPLPYSPAPVEINCLVEALLSSLASSRDPMERGVKKVELDLQDDLPEARIDPSQIEQALLEVISNALEAMPKGGTLTIRTRLSDGGCRMVDVGEHSHIRHLTSSIQHPSIPDDGPFIEIVVSDTGEGIPEEIMPQVFEPFFTTKADGTGLGLAIAKRFVEQNKGTLTISSGAGRGTSVRIILPASLISRQQESKS